MNPAEFRSYKHKLPITVRYSSFRSAKTDSSAPIPVRQAATGQRVAAPPRTARRARAPKVVCILTTWKRVLI